MSATAAAAIAQPEAWTSVAPGRIADLAVEALRAEAELTPKPGLVDRRGGNAHGDVNLGLLIASADSLRDAFEECAVAARQLPLGVALRARVGAIGREGERRMLAATGGVNTHRGALWALGLLGAGAAREDEIDAIVEFAAELARLPDAGLAAEARATVSNGARAGIRYGAEGAAGEARAGFPHVTGCALPALRRSRARGADEGSARLDALLAVMASLEDTCLLHRGGRTGLEVVRRGAAGVVAAGGCTTPVGRLRLEALDHVTRIRRLSTGGSADLLAAAIFLDSLTAAKGNQDRHADPRLSLSR